MEIGIFANMRQEHLFCESVHILPRAVRSGRICAASCAGKADSQVP